MGIIVAIGPRDDVRGAQQGGISDAREGSWSAENEQLAKDKLGKDVKRFWIVNARRAFSCDGQPPYNEQADYDSVDDVNASLAIRCESGGTC